MALPKDSDDEMVYTALAAKIGSSGFASYNLREISIEPADVFWRLSLDKKGNFLGLLKQSGVDYYDVPHFFSPPFFPAVLAASHGLLNASQSFLVLKRTSPRNIHLEGAYSALPNLLFGLLFLIGVFFLGRELFSKTTGILASLFCVTSPVFLIASFKVWTDMLASALVVWAVFLWHKNTESKHGAATAGLLMGLAALTRTSALFALPIFFTYKPRKLLMGACVALAVMAPWFYEVYRHYGTLFYFPEGAQTRQQLDWLHSISRPWYFYIVDVLYLSPIFIVGFFARGKKALMLAGWVLSFLLPLSLLLNSSKPLGLEDRYLLPCYAALAILAAKGCEMLKRYLSQKVMAILVVVLCLWSLRLGCLLVWSRESLRFVP